MSSASVAKVARAARAARAVETVKTVKTAKAENVKRARPAVPKFGEINIVGLFEAEAAALLQAADRGHILHKTHNIRDSGALLESTFRQIIGRRLPAQAQMAHGYLYDLESTCTPQVDAMILTAADNYPMMTAEGEAIYAPFTSCRAYVEIKSSTGSVSNVAKQLGQAAKISTRIAEMASTLGPHLAGIAVPDRVGSVLLYANSSGVKAAPFAKWFSKNSKELTLVIFLDKAVVISRRPMLNEFFQMDDENQHIEPLDLAHPFEWGEAWVYKPDAKTISEARGRVLLWLYYWLLYCSTHHEVELAKEKAGLGETADGICMVRGIRNQQPPVAAFIAAANIRFPLFAIKSLADCGGEIPSFEPC